GTLMAQPFDADRAQLSGDAQPVVEHIGSSGSFAFFGVGGDVLAYRTGSSRDVALEQLSWNDRTGKELAKIGTPVALTPGPNVLSIAPDAKRAALSLTQGSVVPDLWLVE